MSNVTKTLSSLLVILVVISSGNSQSTIQSILTTSDNTPIPYVNIGIEGKAIGTVSDERGEFILELPAIHEQAEITFSSIGFETKKIKATDITDKVIMKATSYQVEEVVITGKKLKEKRLGIKSTAQNIQSGFQTNSLGAELAVKMKVKRRQRVYPKTFNISITQNNCDSLFFRLNFYDVENGRPGKNVTTENIFITTKIDSGILQFDLIPYNLEFEDDFFVGLEWVRDQCPDMSEGDINFSSKLFKKFFYRSVSQDEWSKIGIVGVGMWLDVFYEKK